MGEAELFTALTSARTTSQVEAILRGLKVVEPDDVSDARWRPGELRWVPVGRDRGNSGRIKLAGEPTSPIAERLINGMEAIIELERTRELIKRPVAAPPSSPRDAALRYFNLPRLDSIPGRERDEVRLLRQRIDEVRQKLRVRLAFDNKSREFAVLVRDRGIGQTAIHMHSTLLSLGASDKPDKPYLIGVFGQGGSSAFAASHYSVVISRRAPDVLQRGEDDRVGWSIVKEIYPKGRRDSYYAYLAQSEDGTAPGVDAKVAEAAKFSHGSHFCHIRYDFGGAGSAVARLLYQSLNHVLFNPVLPYDLYTISKDKPELMQGTAQRLARQVVLLDSPAAVDRSFAPQAIA